MSEVWRRTKENYYMTPLERLKSRTTIDENGCWNLGESGYCAFLLNGHMTTGHRASWILHNGDIPKGMVVCHKCDNTRCANPEHLFIGTQADNVKDMFSKKRDGASVWRKAIDEYLRKENAK